MNTAAKKRIKKATEKYITKNDINRPKRKNKAPEKEEVKKLMGWLRENEFSVNVVESKAVYDPNAKRYLSGQTDAGFSDITGTDKNGFAVFVEAKAPGKLKTLKYNQREFLLEKIKLNAFAVCADSVERLKVMYAKWLKLKLNGEMHDAQRFLILHLPECRLAKEDDGELIF